MAADLHNITLAILVGGAGRRMGKPKAWLHINGEPILTRLHQTLQWPGQTMLVTVPGRENAPSSELFDRQVIDEYEEGPLRGVFTALMHSTTDVVIVMPVDMIRISTKHLSWLADEFPDQSAGLMMSRNGTLEPLPLIARRTVSAQIASRLTEGKRSLRGLAESGIFDIVASPKDWIDDVWMNLNEPDDLHGL